MSDKPHSEEQIAEYHGKKVSSVATKFGWAHVGYDGKVHQTLADFIRSVKPQEASPAEKVEES